MSRHYIKIALFLSLTGFLAVSCGGGSSAVSGDNRATDANHQGEKQSVITTIKQHTGHYVVVKQSVLPNQLSQLLEQRGVQGIVKQYGWREIETSVGNYDFSQMRADLAVVSEKKKYLIVQIDLITRGTEKFLPDYLERDYILSAQGSAPVLKIWDMYVIDRLNILFTELSAHFDNEANFEGVVITTPDVQLDEQTKTKYAYSEDAHRTALNLLFSTSKTAFASSKLFWSITTGTSNSKVNTATAARVSALGVIVGGTELLPDHSDWATVITPIYKANKDRTLLFAVVGQASFAHPRADTSIKAKYWTMPLLAEYAKQTLGVDYLFWEQKLLRDPADSYQWSDVIPVLEAAIAP